MEPGQPPPAPQPVQFGSYAELYDQAVDNLNQIPKYRNADGILFVCALQTEIKRLQNRQIDKSLTRDPRDKKAVLNAEGIEPQPGPRVKDLKTVQVEEIMQIYEEKKKGDYQKVVADPCFCLYFWTLGKQGHCDRTECGKRELFPTSCRATWRK